MSREAGGKLIVVNNLHEDTWMGKTNTLSETKTYNLHPQARQRAPPLTFVWDSPFPPFGPPPPYPLEAPRGFARRLLRSLIL